MSIKAIAILAAIAILGLIAYLIASAFKLKANIHRSDFCQNEAQGAGITELQYLEAKTWTSLS